MVRCVDICECVVWCCKGNVDVLGIVSFKVCSGVVRCSELLLGVMRCVDVCRSVVRCVGMQWCADVL